MKAIFFHQQGYRDLPDDFRTRYPSIWTTVPNRELCDPHKVGQYLNWNLDELEYAMDLGFHGVATNEHHQNAFGFPVTPNLTAAVLARKDSDAAIINMGNVAVMYNPPLRVAEEIAMLDCLSGGRMVAGLPVGLPADTILNYGIAPTEVRPRFYEAHDLITQAWTRPGPFPFNGKYTKLRYVNPWPIPVQRPHPPIWLAGGGSIETWEMAAKYDYPYSYVSLAGFKSAKTNVDLFWNVQEKAGRDDNPYRVSFAQIVMVGETDADAEASYAKHCQNFFAKALHTPPQYMTIPGYMTTQSLRAQIQRTGTTSPWTSASRGTTPTWSTMLESGTVIGGGPDTVAQQLKHLMTSMRAGRLIILMQLQSMPTEVAKKNLKLFAEKVLPQIENLWDDKYEDRWWPANARRGANAKTKTAVGSAA
ncbi:MAG TPA: LLM class flavin-dependent oxidoreductase [Bradyrhizobium sp.]|nr:LLM class flavin-dependent oxidoreductase [Bradyrhizobium sp.]